MKAIMSTLGARRRLGSRRSHLGLAAATLLALSLFVMSVSAAGAGGGDHGAAHDVGSHGINWYYGLFGEDPEIKHPTIAYRMPGMPVPLVANFFNAGLLFFLLYRFGKKPISDALIARRERIMGGMEEAGKMKAEAAEELASYETKLNEIDSEIERIKREMKEAARAEREQILSAAKSRRERMERETKLLIEQERKAARQELFEQTVRNAMSGARELIASHITSADHDRLSEEYLTQLAERPSAPAGERA